MIRSGIYLRVSTDAQASEGTSLHTQEAICLAKSAEIGAAVVEIVRDEGVSGAKLTSRVGIQRILSLVEAREIDVVIIANFSRYSRDVEHQQAIKRRVERAGGRLVFCDMDLPNTPEGNLAFGIFGTFAAYERQVIVARTSKGRRAKAELGQQPARSRSPFGYHIPTRDEVLQGLYPIDQIGKYVIVEPFAQVVRDIFTMAAAGASLSEIAKAQESSGTPTPRGSNMWHRESVRCLLRNPVYKGAAAFGRTRCVSDERYKQGIKKPTDQSTWTTIECPALVTPEKWDRAQVQLARNKEIRIGRVSNTLLLSGLLSCPCCGGRMYGTTTRTVKKTTAYYRCYRSKGESPVKCPAPSIRAEVADQLVSEAIDQLAKHKQVVTALSRYKVEAARKDSPVEIWQAEWDKLERREAATIKSQTMAIEAGADPLQYNAIFRTIRDQKDKLRATKPTEDPVPENVDWVSSISKEIRIALKHGDQRKNNQLLKTIFHEIILDGDTARVLMWSPLIEDNDKTVPIYMTISSGKVSIERYGHAYKA